MARSVALDPRAAVLRCYHRHRLLPSLPSSPATSDPPPTPAVLIIARCSDRMFHRRGFEPRRRCCCIGAALAAILGV